MLKRSVLIALPVLYLFIECFQSLVRLHEIVQYIVIYCSRENLAELDGGKYIGLVSLVNQDNQCPECRKPTQLELTAVKSFVSRPSLSERSSKVSHKISIVPVNAK